MNLHSRSFAAFAILVFTLLAPRPVSASEAPLTNPKIFLAGTPIAEGKLALYYVGWGGDVVRVDLGPIWAGQTHLPSFTEFSSSLDAEKERRNWADALWIVVQVPGEMPGIQWFQSPQLSEKVKGAELAQAARWSAQEMYRALPKWIAQLGVMRSPGVINIPAPVLHSIWLKNLDSTARAGQEITVQPYVYNSNHCGGHVSFRREELAKLTSDFEGKVQFMGPLLPTWAQISYLSLRDAYSEGERAVWASEETLKLSAGPAQIITRQWEAPGVARDYQIAVVDEHGKGISGLTLVAFQAISGCGISSEAIGESDSSGRFGVEDSRLSVPLNFEMIDMLKVSYADAWQAEHLYEFNDVEIAELIRFGSLNVRLVDIRR